MSNAMRTLWRLTRRTAQAYGEDSGTHLAAGIAFYALFAIVPLTIFAASVFGLVVRDEGAQRNIADEIVEALNLDPGDIAFELDRPAIETLYGPAAADEILAAIDGLSDAEKAGLRDDLGAGRDVSLAGRALTPDQLSARNDNPIVDTVRAASRGGGALTAIGFIATAWSASALFAAVRRSLNIIWGVGAHRPFVQQKAVDLGMVFGFGLLLIASVAATAALVTLRELSDEAFGPLSTGVWSVLPFLLPALLSFAVFAALYRYVPNAEVSFRIVWPGALFAAALFEALKNGFSFYVANFTSYDLAYGTLGGVLLFMLWAYLTANILLIGAELSSEYRRLQRGELAPAHAPAPGERQLLREKAWRFVRGLFFHEHERPIGRPPEA